MLNQACRFRLFKTFCQAAGVERGALEAEGHAVAEVEARLAHAERAHAEEKSALENKLRWYAENQSLIGDYVEQARKDQQTIKHLQQQVRRQSPQLRCEERCGILCC